MKTFTHLLAATSVLAFLAVPDFAQQPLNPPLKNWAAPLQWMPRPAEAEGLRASRGDSVQINDPGTFAGAGAMTFIAVTPCRLVDTRTTQNQTGQWGPPSLSAYTDRNFNIPQSTNCPIPSTAGAYSLNFTVVPVATLSFLSAWPEGQGYPGVSVLNDAVAGGAIANAAIVVAGTNGGITVAAGNATDLIIDINGYYTTPTDAALNTAIGLGAGSSFTGTGGALNTAVGGSALSSDTGGGDNTAVGDSSLRYNVVGNGNTAVGQNALTSNTGSNNTAVGFGALSANTSGGGNIGVGALAGSQVPAGNSNNIMIGSQGTSTDNTAIRIGTGQTYAQIAGIFGVTTGGSGAPVVIDSTGQLGTISSSRRYKEDIQDMGDASDGLLQLRPVTFRYKKPYADGSMPLDYGLIAEEVAQVYPDLVVKGADGKIETVQYQKLTSMLLNELQKEHSTVESLEARLAALEARLSSPDLSAVAADQ